MSNSILAQIVSWRVVKAIALAREIQTVDKVYSSYCVSCRCVRFIIYSNDYYKGDIV